MRGTKDQRWAAVYGAAYYAMAYETVADDHESIRTCQAHAESVADAAIAAEPEEADSVPVFKDADGVMQSDAVTVWASGHSFYIENMHRDGEGRWAILTRSEAAALARLLARFAETGEL